MSENENQAMNWTMGLAGSIILHVVVVGLFLAMSGSDSAPPEEPAAAPSVEASQPSPPPVPVTSATAAEAVPPPVVARPSRPNPVAPSTTPSPAPSPSPRENSAEKVYVVQRGDNASKIARRYDLTLQELAALNGTTVQKLGGIAIGQRLKVAE